jgi:hypothetical protein
MRSASAVLVLVLSPAGPLAAATVLGAKLAGKTGADVCGFNARTPLAAVLACCLFFVAVLACCFRGVVLPFFCLLADCEGCAAVSLLIAGVFDAAIDWRGEV